MRKQKQELYQTEVSVVYYKNEHIHKFQVLTSKRICSSKKRFHVPIVYVFIKETQVWMTIFLFT